MKTITLESSAVDTIREALELAEGTHCIACCNDIDADGSGHDENCVIAVALDELISFEE